MRVNINKNSEVSSDVLHDNILEDCDVKSIDLYTCHNLADFLIKSKKCGVLAGHSMSDWGIGKNGEITNEFGEYDDSEGISLVLYFNFKDEVKKRKKEAKERMGKVLQIMESELYSGRHIYSNGISLIIKAIPGTVTFEAVVKGINESVQPLYSKKIKDQTVLKFCLDRASGYDPLKAINFNSSPAGDHDVNIYYSTQSREFIIY